MNDPERLRRSLAVQFSPAGHDAGAEHPRACQGSAWDRATREPFPKEAQLARRARHLMDRHGLIGRAGDIFFIAPPLYVTRSEVDFLVTLRKVLSCGFERALIPVDELLPALYMDHPREDIRLLYPKRLSAYALEPALITQLPKHEAGSDTEASAFVVNKKASAERDRPVTALAKHMDAVWSAAENA